MSKMSDALAIFSTRFSDCKTTTMAASVAFFTALSLAPLVVIFLALSPLIGSATKDSFISQVSDLVGPSGGVAMGMILKSAEARLDLASLSGVVGAVILIISASTVFGEMRSAFNTILDAGPEPKENTTVFHAIWSFIESRFFYTGLALGFIFIMIISLLATSTITMLLDSSNNPLGDFAVAANILVSYILYALVFTLLFHFLPKKHMTWKKALYSSLLTALLFVVGKEIVGLYLGRSSLSSSYGAAGSLIVLLAWVYYSALIIFVGAHFSYAYLQATGKE